MKRTDDTRRGGWQSRVLYIASALALIGQHGALVGYKTYANVDEAYAMALASRLIDGRILYEGAVSQRGPLMYYVYEALARLFGWDNVLGLRLAALLWSFVVLGTIAWAARATLRAAPPLLALVVAAYALSWGIPPIDGVALHGETLQVPAMLVAYVLGARAMRTPIFDRRIRLVCASGIALGAAVCIKQNVLVHIAPLLAWLLVRGSLHRRAGRIRALQTCAAYIGSVLFVPAIFLLNAWRNGSIRSFVYYTWTYNTTIHVGGERTSRPWLRALMGEVIFNRDFILALLLVGVVGGIWTVRRVRSGGYRALLRGFGTRQYLALHLVVGVVGACALMRFFPHYFVPSIAYLSIAIAGAVGSLVPSRLILRLRTPMALVASLYLVFCGAVGAYANEKIDGRVEESRTVKQVSSYVRAATTPSDRVFVWGFSPWIYGYSGRRPAGRFVFETYVTGFVPWTWGDLPIEYKRVVPNSMNQLMADLEAEDPKVIVDAGEIMLARSMRAYEAPARFLHERYCFALRVSAYDIYLKKAGGACPTAAFPILHHPVDFNDLELEVESPPALDAKEAKLLVGEAHLPVFFGRAPPFCEAARDLWWEKERAKDGVELVNPCAAADSPSP